MLNKIQLLIIIIKVLELYMEDTIKIILLSDLFHHQSFLQSSNIEKSIIRWIIKRKKKISIKIDVSALLN